ncbi:hypothetical protein, partial [Janibacter hoylei]|uniref:hypothetical protein n=1 Tax=Janibacter hoylei TaxID=364298 RepID=UPI002492D9BC
GAVTQSKTVTVYPQSSAVESTSSSTKLTAGTFSSASGTPDSFNQRFEGFRVQVNIVRTDGSLPSGFDSSFEYLTSDSDLSFDGDIDLTKYYDDNLPAGNYEVTV